MGKLADFRAVHGPNVKWFNSHIVCQGCTLDIGGPGSGETLEYSENDYREYLQELGVPPDKIEDFKPIG